MNWITKIQEAIGHMEDNLLGDLSAGAVGRAVNYSPSALQGLFGAVTGYSLGEYVRFRRLSCAADDLAAGRESVTGAAAKYGYESAESFSKAFRRLFGVSPSALTRPGARCARFAPMKIEFLLHGGFDMERNVIPNLPAVDWSDTGKQNEFVISVISALNALGERLDYGYVCAVSGCAFRTSFSMPSARMWNHGNYHVVHAPIIIEHTFRMLGYEVTRHARGGYEHDRDLVKSSIDRGVPVITLEGVVNCADACVISGYDNGGDVLLGCSPFMDVEHDHSEPHDRTGYFRKPHWHGGFFAEGGGGIILIIGGRRETPPKEERFARTMALAARLIGEERLAEGQYNGLAAHRAFAEALMTYAWKDNSEPYLNVMCNYKQYLDRQYAAAYLRDNGRDDLASYYDRIAGLAGRLGRLIPQDFTAGERFGDRENLRPYAETLLEIRALEEEFLRRIS